MKITLYKGCRLNKSYCEVLDTIAPVTYDSVQYQNALEAYLQSLVKHIVTTEENVYATNSGKFSFELDLGQAGTFYEYNYMKVEDTINNLTRYYFINTITVVNGIAVVEYEEDIWANYSKTMHIRKSLLTRSRSIKYGAYNIPFFKLGMEYESNNEISGRVLETDAFVESDIGKVYIVAQLQLYRLETGGKRTDLMTRSVMLFNDDFEHSRITYDFSIGESLTDFLTQLVNYQSTGSFVFSPNYMNGYGITQNTWYYEISNIYLIPKVFGLRPIGTPQWNVPQTPSQSIPANYMGRFDFQNAGIFINKAVSCCDLYRCMLKDYYNPSSLTGIRYIESSEITFSGFEIENDFKIIGIGAFTSVIELQLNGSNIKGTILSHCDDYNFMLYISIQNQIIDFSENYRVDIPFTVQTADVLQQAKTARELEKLNSDLQIGKGALGIFQGGINMASSIATTALGAMTGQVGTIAGGVSGIGGSLGTIYSGVSNIVKGVKNLEILNRPLYRTNKGTFARSSGILNAEFGLLIFLIDADNTVEVQANIDNAGYVVNEIVDDLLHVLAVANDKPAYNVMAFGFVNNYGYFPENIRIQLADILMNGFKIWYDVASYIAS